MLSATMLLLGSAESARADEGGGSGPSFEQQFLYVTGINYARHELKKLLGGSDKPKPFFIEARPDSGTEGAPSTCSADSDGGATPNPVLIKTGNKFKVEVDWAGDQAEMPLTITRTYNRSWTGQGVFGPNWPSVFDYKLAFFIDEDHFGYARPVDDPRPVTNGASAALQKVYVDRPDGSRFTYTFKPGSGNRWEGDKPGAMTWLLHVGTTWELHNEDRSVETYNDYGHVLNVTDQFGIGWSFTYLNNNKYQIDKITHTSGRFLKFNWGSDPRVASIEDPAGDVYDYDYTFSGRLLEQVNSPGIQPSIKTH